MMKNKNILVFILLCVFSTVTYAKKGKVEKEISDREYWAQMAYKIAAPVEEKYAGRDQPNMGWTQ